MPNGRMSLAFQNPSQLTVINYLDPSFANKHPPAIIFLMKQRHAFHILIRHHPSSSLVCNFGGTPRLDKTASPLRRWFQFQGAPPGTRSPPFRTHVFVRRSGTTLQIGTGTRGFFRRGGVGVPIPRPTHHTKSNSGQTQPEEPRCGLECSGSSDFGSALQCIPQYSCCFGGDQDERVRKARKWLVQNSIFYLLSVVGHGYDC